MEEDSPGLAHIGFVDVLEVELVDVGEYQQVLRLLVHVFQFLLPVLVKLQFLRVLGLAGFPFVDELGVQALVLQVLDFLDFLVLFRGANVLHLELLSFHVVLERDFQLCLGLRHFLLLV